MASTNPTILTLKQISAYNAIKDKPSSKLGKSFKERFFLPPSISTPSIRARNNFIKATEKQAPQATTKEILERLITKGKTTTGKTTTGKTTTTRKIGGRKNTRRNK